MCERHFEHYIFDHQVRERLDEYLNRKRRRGYEAEVTTRPFKAAGAYPIAVVRINQVSFRLFYSPEGRWKVRSKTFPVGNPCFTSLSTDAA
jgi:hypothetical protein